MNELKRKRQGEDVCARLVSEIHKLGFMPQQLGREPTFDEAAFERSKDPYNGEETLCGYWRDGKGGRIGQIKFHGDGSYYAEYDVILPHPKDPRWFVEGVVAWGRDGVIKGEAKLLPALDDTK